ncbi:hypothetical protein AVEN_63245-1 [Araneus ventricosus]|uniref:Uncharacterized protein n=1 Tax=Araneus ventricosus TaxID=182803 RepID=A0A4Y2B386_ARAVE|nr:hypothetical protein AVEN_63245-1 [Araneus ventricosus]
MIILSQHSPNILSNHIISVAASVNAMNSASMVDRLMHFSLKVLHMIGAWSIKIICPPIDTRSSLQASKSESEKATILGLKQDKFNWQKEVDLTYPKSLNKPFQCSLPGLFC